MMSRTSNSSNHKEISYFPRENIENCLPCRTQQAAHLQHTESQATASHAKGWTHVPQSPCCGPRRQQGAGDLQQPAGTPSLMLLCPLVSHSPLRRIHPGLTREFHPGGPVSHPSSSLPSLVKLSPGSVWNSHLWVFKSPVITADESHARRRDLDFKFTQSLTHGSNLFPSQLPSLPFIVIKTTVLKVSEDK